MALVHEQAVNAQLLKGDYIVLLVRSQQLVQPCFQGFPGLFHLLDGKVFAPAVLELCDSVLNLFNLLPQKAFLPFRRNRNLFKLAVADDHGIVIPGGDPGTELLPVLLFKVLSACHQNLGAGIEPQKLTGPLQRQVIRYYEQALMAQAEPLAFHGCRRHFKGFPGTDFVRQQRVAAVKHMGNRVALMLPQPDIRVHADKMNVLPVILPRTGRIEQLVIPSGQGFPALRVFPYPVLERILDCLLFLLSKRGFLLVQDTAFFAVRILHLVIDSHVLQVQRILQNLIGIGTGGSVGYIAVHVAVAGRAFSFNAPFRR